MEAKTHHKIQLPEHLKTYWKTWKENVNEKNSIKINQDTLNQLATLLPMHSARNAPPPITAAQPITARRQITAGVRSDPPPSPIDRWHVGILLDQHTAAQSAVQYSFGASGLVSGTSLCLPKEYCTAD